MLPIKHCLTKTKNGFTHFIKELFVEAVFYRTLFVISFKIHSTFTSTSRKMIITNNVQKKMMMKKIIQSAPLRPATKRARQGEWKNCTRNIEEANKENRCNVKNTHKVEEIETGKNSSRSRSKYLSRKVFVQTSLSLFP